MGDDNDDLAAVGDAAQLGEDLAGDHAVKAGVRLVENKEFGVGDQLHRDRDPSELAAGLFADKAVRAGGKAQQIHDLSDLAAALPARGGRRQTQLRRVGHSADDGVVAADEVLLRNKADAVFHLAIVPIDVFAVEQNLGVRLFIADHGVDERRLAGAGAAEQQHHRAVGDVERDVLEQIALFAEVAYRTLAQIDREATLARPGAMCGRGVGDLGGSGARLLALLGVGDLKGDEFFTGAEAEHR